MQNANPVSSRVRVLAAALLALTIAGCGSGKPADAAPEAKSVADHFEISLGGHPAHLQIAVLQSEQERGLMQRPDLGKDDGMIFVCERPQRQRFWMKNTPEALDIAYVAPDGVIAEIYPLYPFDERSVNSISDRLQLAVEMPQGWFAANGVRPGASLDMKALGDALKARGFDPDAYRFR